MQKLKRLLIRSFIAIIFLGLLFALLNFIFLDFIIDFLWFGSLNLKGYFILRLVYRYLILGFAGFIFFAIFFLNFRKASRYLGTGEENKDRDLIRMFRKGSWKIYTAISLVLAIPITIPLFKKWETALLFVSGLLSDKTGIADPVFHKDISYYLFSFPVYKLIHTELLIVFIVLFLFIGLIYWAESRFLSRDNKHLPRGPKIHLTVLFLIICLIQTWGFFLQEYDLLYATTHQPLFLGPGWLEINFDLWCIRLTMIFFILTALSAVILVYKRNKASKAALVGSVLILVLVIGVHKTPSLARKYMEELIVKPNELILEKNYIKNSIKATLAAFDLTSVETRKYDIKKTSDILNHPDVQQSLRNIPVWDLELLDGVYQHLQAPQNYYSFTGVDTDRYTVEGGYQQVYLAGRELNVISDDTSARDTWLNKHLKYTHGYGFVMTSAAQDGDENMNWYARDMPLKSEYGFSNIRKLGIYYGMANYDYAIAPNNLKEIEYPEEDMNVTVNYQGNGGVDLTFYRKLLFSLYFRDIDIITTQAANNKSRFLFHRNFREFIKKITPYFILDRDPYLVVTNKGLFWIQDAYTISDKYPNAESYNEKYNYIRNSVKIVVDAYNGTTDYYIADPDDPIIRAYNKIYPGLLKEQDQIPSELKPHLRYPKMMFEAQMKIYAKYHQTDPDLFYQQGDNWDFAQVTPNSMKSYYLTLNLLTPAKHEFLLLCPMSPEGRNNLRSLAIAGCDGENYGKIFVFSFPRGTQIDGPSRISAKIDRDIIISQELTLWDQRGSEVIRGRVIVMPVANTFLYIQPVYLRSETGPNIPELKQIIVSQGGVVAMDESLKGAIKQLELKLASSPVPETESEPEPETEDVAPEEKITGQQEDSSN